MYRDPLFGFKNILKLILFLEKWDSLKIFFNYYYIIEQSDSLIMKSTIGYMSTKLAKFQNMLYYTQIVFVSRQCTLDGSDAKRRTFADL